MGFFRSWNKPKPVDANPKEASLPEDKTSVEITLMANTTSNTTWNQLVAQANAAVGGGGGGASVPTPFGYVSGTTTSPTYFIQSGTQISGIYNGTLVSPYEVPTIIMDTRTEFTEEEMEKALQIIEDLSHA